MDTSLINDKKKSTNDFDKKVSFLVKKEKKAIITYVVGLHNFEIDIPSFCKKVKVDLGTGSRESELDGQKIYGFNGDRIDQIIGLLIKCGIDKLNIKK